MVEGTIPPSEAVWVDIEVDTNDAAEAAKRFKDAHPEARIESINGDLIRGICECGTPVFENTKGYGFDNEACMYFCPQCVVELQAQRKKCKT